MVLLVVFFDALFFLLYRLLYVLIFKINFADEVTEGLSLSVFELAAITYIREEIAIAPKKDVVRIGGVTLNAGQLNCLVRPLREDGGPIELL